MYEQEDADDDFGLLSDGGSRGRSILYGCTSTRLRNVAVSPIVQSIEAAFYSPRSPTGGCHYCSFCNASGFSDALDVAKTVSNDLAFACAHRVLARPALA